MSYLNKLESYHITNKNLITLRMNDSKNYKSVHHTHSWIINKARWNTNNEILYNNTNEKKEFIHQANFLKSQIISLEFDHLQYIKHLNIKISNEQLSIFRYLTIVNNNVVYIILLLL